MTDRELLKAVLCAMSQRELNALLNRHGLDTEAGDALHHFLAQKDVENAMGKQFDLDKDKITPSKPDTLKLAIYRFLRPLMNDFLRKMAKFYS